MPRHTIEASRSRRLAVACYRAAILLSLAACNDAVKDVPPPPVAESGVVASGTRVQGTTQQALSSRTARPGDTVAVLVSRSVNDGLGKVAIPAGSRVLVTVERLESATDETRADGQLSLVVSAVNVNEHSYHVAAALEEVPHHLEWRDGHADAPHPGMPHRTTYRDVIVSAGTPVVFTLAHSLKVSAM